jgi:uncharacterized protein HemY
MSILLELRFPVSVEMLVQGVILDLTLNLLVLHALARLLGPLWNPANHQRTWFRPTLRLATLNERSALSD